MKTYRFAGLLALSALAALACSKSESAGNTATSNHEAQGTTAAAAGGKVDLAKAETIFNERCSACHGPQGRGDGPASAALNPKPRNYTDSAWQASVTDEQIAKTITMGGAAVGKSPIMPASPDLDEKPEVVAGLVKIVRKFAH
jgi:mono/diheme cytochrome c family protein